MKKISCILLVSFLLLSCRIGNKKDAIQQLSVKEFTKLEKLSLLSPDSIIDYFDLSDESIVNFPDLSTFNIESLDLSHNLLDTIIPHFLPKGLEKLNLSHNQYSGYVLIKKNTIPILKELDMSYNQLHKIDTVVREGVANGKRLLAPNAPLFLIPLLYQSNEVTDRYN